jgi:hypothetical protein
MSTAQRDDVLGLLAKATAMKDMWLARLRTSPPTEEVLACVTRLRDWDAVRATKHIQMLELQRLRAETLFKSSLRQALWVTMTQEHVPSTTARASAAQRSRSSTCLAVAASG